MTDESIRSALESTQPVALPVRAQTNAITHSQITYQQSPFIIKDIMELLLQRFHFHRFLIIFCGVEI